MAQTIVFESGPWNYNGGNKDGTGTVRYFDVISGHRYKVTFRQQIGNFNGGLVSSNFASLFPTMSSRCGFQKGLAVARDRLATKGCSTDPTLANSGDQTVISDDPSNVSDYTGQVTIDWSFDQSPWNNAYGILTITVEDLSLPKAGNRVAGLIG